MLLMHWQSLGVDGVLELLVLLEKEEGPGVRPSFASFSTASEGNLGEGTGGGLWLLVRSWPGPLMGKVKLDGDSDLVQ